mmetsp:Transcript_19988/g.58050  ORF Transcript_19988/g.58050 Transcript_19988/m.58050 type:complete len:338 (+) Transcript_19988:375-1388(+)
MLHALCHAAPGSSRAGATLRPSPVLRSWLTTRPSADDTSNSSPERARRKEPCTEGARTSPAGSQDFVAKSTSKRSTLSSPSYFTAARRPPTPGRCETVAAAKPLGNAGAAMSWQRQAPGRHSATWPPEVATTRLPSVHEAPRTSPARPWRAKGSTRSTPPAGERRRCAPWPVRARAARPPSCEATRCAGLKSAGHSKVWARNGGMANTALGGVVVIGVSSASAKGPRLEARRWAKDAISSCCCISAPLRRRSQPPAWHISFREPLRVHGDIQGCMCDGQRSMRPSCFRSQRSPLTCSKARPTMIKTHMLIVVMLAPRKSFHTKVGGAAFLALRKPTS